MATSVSDFLFENSIYAGPKGARCDSDEAFSFLNRARKKLYEQGDYKGTILVGQVYLYNSLFVPPFEIEAIRAVYIGDAPHGVRNSHFTTIDPSTYEFYNGCKAAFASTGRTFGFIGTNLPSSYSIGFSAENINDVGAEICVKYKEECGTIKSAIVVLTDDWATAEVPGAIATSILGISKKITFGPIKIHLNGCCLATIHPHETATHYNEYRVAGCVASQYVTIRGKKKFIPYAKGKDECSILDLSDDSVAFAMRAVTAQEQGDPAAYAQWLKLARDHAELDQENFQTTVTPSLESMKVSGAYTTSSYNEC